MISSVSFRFCTLDLCVGSMKQLGSWCRWLQGLDKGDDGIVASVSHLTMGHQVVGSYEKICVGTVKFGMRSTQVRAPAILGCGANANGRLQLASGFCSCCMIQQDVTQLWSISVAVCPATECCPVLQ
jgi:hypothetical protein